MAERLQRPWPVWVILILYGLNVLMLAIGLVTLVVRAIHGQGPSVLGALSAVIGILNAVGTGHLFFMRRQTPIWLSAALVVSIITAPYYFMHAPASGARPLGAVIGLTLAALICGYTWTLRQRGVLKGPARRPTSGDDSP